MKRFAATLALVLALPSAALAQRSSVTDSIRKQADQFITAIASRDIDKFVGLFTADSDFIYVDAGRIYPDRPALRAAGAGFFKRIKTFSGTWNPAKVLVLGPTGGVFTGQMQVQAADTSGAPIWPLGKIWTLAYQRRGGHWLIVQAHEANVPAPRPPTPAR